jgi:hypothetical protein
MKELRVTSRILSGLLDGVAKPPTGNVRMGSFGSSREIGKCPVYIPSEHPSLWSYVRMPSIKTRSWLVEWLKQ